MGMGKTAKSYRSLNGTVVDELQKKLLIRRFQQLIGKEWAPVDPTDLFSESLVSFQEIV